MGHQEYRPEEDVPDDEYTESPEDAQQLLKQIEQMVRQTRASMASSGDHGKHNMLVWNLFDQLQQMFR